MKPRQARRQLKYYITDFVNRGLSAFRCGYYIGGCRYSHSSSYVNYGVQGGNQYAAVGLMVILGTAFFGAAYMSYRNLDTSYDRLYFEHFGITLRGAPKRVVNRLTRIPGVQAVEGRLLEDVAIELPGVTTRKLVGRLKNSWNCFPSM